MGCKLGWRLWSKLLRITKALFFFFRSESRRSLRPAKVGRRISPSSTCTIPWSHTVVLLVLCHSDAANLGSFPIAAGILAVRRFPVRRSWTPISGSQSPPLSFSSLSKCGHSLQDCEQGHFFPSKVPGKEHCVLLGFDLVQKIANPLFVGSGCFKHLHLRLLYSCLSRWFLFYVSDGCDVVLFPLIYAQAWNSGELCCPISGSCNTSNPLKLHDIQVLFVFLNT